MIHFRETECGFEFGAATVTRIYSGAIKGWVILGIQTPKYKNPIQIYVTKTGKVRISSEGVEWKPQDP